MVSIHCCQKYGLLKAFQQTVALLSWYPLMQRVLDNHWVESWIPYLAWNWRHYQCESGKIQAFLNFRVCHCSLHSFISRYVYSSGDQIIQARRFYYVTIESCSLQILTETVVVKLSTTWVQYSQGKYVLPYQLFQESLHSCHFRNRFKRLTLELLSAITHLSAQEA